MTPERKKALWTIGSTLLIGILIGALSMGLLQRQRGGGHRRMGGWKDGGRERFVQKINEVVNATPEQAAAIKPYIIETSTRIDSLQLQTDRQVKATVDSLEIKLAPLLEKDQLENLKAFHRRGRRSR
jgi:hypothetical protein